MENKKLPKWLWAVPAALVIIVAVVVGDSSFQKGAFLNFRRFQWKTPMNQMRQAPARSGILSDLSIGTVDTKSAYPYFRVNLTGLNLSVGFKTQVMYRVGKLSNPGNKGSDIVKTYPLTYGIDSGSYAHKEFDKNLLDDSYSVTIFVDPDNVIAESNERNNSKTEEIFPSLARCQQLHMWWDLGVLSQNVGNPYPEVTICGATYGTFEVYAHRCIALRTWLGNGVLSNYYWNPNETVGCQNYYSEIWNRPSVTLARCRQLNTWVLQSVLTQNLGNNLGEVATCNIAFGSVYTSPARCANVKAWAQQNLLTANSVSPEELLTCHYYYP